LALLLAALCLAACASQDIHIYESTDQLPTTVTIIDTTTHETVWSKPVPLRHRLEVDLDREGENEFIQVSGRPATSMHFRLKDAGGHTVESGDVTLPGRALLIKPVYDRKPE
jgi:hypothetical protein